MQLTSHEKKLTQDILDAALSRPDFSKVYFLGPYARRVSFVAQQNRALNLVWALKAIEKISADTKVAVIGAGLAGVTAATALEKIGCEVVLYESASEALHRQRSAAHRYVHPTINHWPESSLDHTTTLPFFDWVSGVCETMMAGLYEEWKAHLDNSNIVFESNITVKGFRETTSKVAVITEGHNKVDANRYDLVLVTSGFSDERLIEGIGLRTYWQDENLENDVLSGGCQFIVSGCGDGGLIDSLRIAHSRFNKGRLMVDIASRLNREQWDGIQQIIEAEKNVWASGTNLETAIVSGSKDLSNTYRELATKLPSAIAEELQESIRMHQPSLVKIVSRERYPFSPLAAPIHKLLIAHAMEAMVIDFEGEHHAAEIKRNSIVLCSIHDLDVEGKPKPDSNLTTLEGRIVVRHGARPNFFSFLTKNDASGQKLAERQRLLAEGLENPLWSEGKNALIEWPPKPPFPEEELAKRLGAGENFLDHIGGPRGHLIFSADEGFIYEYRDSADVDEKLDLIPKELFGFPMKPVRDDERSSDSANAFAAKITQKKAVIETGAKSVLMAGDSIASGALTGRLGPIVKAEEGDELYALTVSHVLADTSEHQIPEVAAPDGRIIGRAAESDLSLTRETVGDVALIKISPEIDCSATFGSFNCINPPLGQSERKSARVITFTTTGEMRRGIINVSSIPVSFRLPDPVGECVISNAIRVRPENKSKPFAEPGDSGAAVVDGEGRLVGLIISGNEKYTYVLPVADFLKERRLIPAQGHALSKPHQPTRTEGESVFGRTLNQLARAKRKALIDEPVDLGKIPIELTDLETGAENAD